MAQNLLLAVLCYITDAWGDDISLTSTPQCSKAYSRILFAVGVLLLKVSAARMVG